MASEPETDESRNERRWELLGRLEGWLEIPMVVLGFVWLALLVVELTAGLGPVLSYLGDAIWVAFVLDFLLRIYLAPDKAAYLGRNWITALALLLPALRVLRAFRAVRVLGAARGVRLARILTSLNRGMRSLGRSMRRRGMGYVLTLTGIVWVAGAAGMYAFERGQPESGVGSFVEALWWTAMLLTTIGSQHWPGSAEGRALTLFLSMYALGVLGYVTAALASFFLGRDAGSEEGEVASEVTLRALHAELRALRAEVRGLRPPGSDRGDGR